MDDIVDWIRENEPDDDKGVPANTLRREFTEAEIEVALRRGTIYEVGDRSYVTDDRPLAAESTASEDDPPTWQDILEEPFVVAILGRRGSGKTALGHRLLQEFAGDDREAYILGFPEEKRELLPEWINWMPPEFPLDRWPQTSVTLVSEAHHVAHARRSLQSENLELDALVSLSRQKDADILFDTQYARRLDITGVMGVNALIIRYPSMMADDFERSQMRGLIKEAREALDEYVDVTETEDYVLRDESPELLRRAYVIGEKFRGLYPREIGLPGHWTEEISKAYGAAGPAVNGEVPAPEEADDPTDDLTFDQWVKWACPHLPADKDDERFQAGIFLCQDCADELDAPPTTPYPAAS